MLEKDVKYYTRVANNDKNRKLTLSNLIIQNVQYRKYMEMIYLRDNVLIPIKVLSRVLYINYIALAVVPSWDE